MTNPFDQGNPFDQSPAGAAPAGPAADPFAAPTGEDPFGDPAPRTDRPRLGDFYDRSDGGQGGRLLLITPHKIEAVPAMNNPRETVDRMTADVVVLDGGPLHWGGKPHGRPAIPHTQVSALPYRSERMFVSSIGIVNQCREALKRRLAGQTGGSMVVGRLSIGEAKDPTRSAPYFLAVASDQDKALARAYWQQHLAAKDPFAA